MNLADHLFNGKFLILSLLVTSCFWTGDACSQNQTYYNPHQNQDFYLSLGIGYGISNNPVKAENEKTAPGGITLSGMLGYRFTPSFSLSFGPALWIEGKDVFASNAAQKERTSNKRTMVALYGTYELYKKYPISINLGTGIGTLIYSPDKNTVTIDHNGISETEYASGFLVSGGLLYKLKLSDKFYLHPSINFYYFSLSPQKIEYESLINDSRASITSDFRCQLFINF